MKTKEIISKVLKSDSLGIARAITYVENELRGYKTILKKLKKHTGNGHIIGVTGFPGAGKSTLVGCLINKYLSLDKKVGVIAVDPTSLSGGAFLGDRTRMYVKDSKNVGDNLYIRSMASRGYGGGLAESTENAVKVLDAAGYDKIFVETVGAGQNDIDIMNIADSSIVVVNPGMGDVQTLKGGIMEIADLYVINKADYPEVIKTEVDINEAIRFLTQKKEWEPKIYKTIARDNEGIDELVEGIEEHFKYFKNKKK